MNKAKAIKLLGVFFIAAGSLELLLKTKDTWWVWPSLFRPGSFISIQDYFFFSTTSIFFLIILPLAILMAGIGILKTKKWGWQLAIIVCAITFIVNVIGIINFAFAVYKSHNIQMPPIPKGAYVGVVSMWPTYISGIICVFLILMLTRKSMKERFNH